MLHSLGRTQLIHTRILMSFSQSLVIHDFRAEVCMIPMFLKQIPQIGGANTNTSDRRCKIHSSDLRYYIHTSNRRYL